MSLGENIKRIRKQRKMTQSELAEKVGVSRSQISNIEKGNRSTSVERQIKIAKVLGVNVGELHDNEEKVPLEDNGYAILTEELKEEGIDPDTARNWIKFAKQFIEQNKNN